MKNWLNPPVEMKKFNVFITRDEAERRYKNKPVVSDGVHVAYLLHGKEIH